MPEGEASAKRRTVCLEGEIAKQMILYRVRKFVKVRLRYTIDAAVTDAHQRETITGNKIKGTFTLQRKLYLAREHVKVKYRVPVMLL